MILAGTTAQSDYTAAIRQTLQTAALYHHDRPEVLEVVMSGCAE